MIKPVYIMAARAVCAQDTFSANQLPENLSDASGNALYYHHPDYSRYFSIMQLRRMSRLTRTGMVAAIESLRDAELPCPGAIITGTGKGSLSDTEKFMSNIREFHEGTLNPTPFIQSTYNSLNGLIGLHHQANSYNTTYVHRGFSLEHALLDAMMLFREGRVDNVLAGCFEEMTEEHFIIKRKLGYWKKEEVSCRELLDSGTAGTISGEGTFFFVLKATAEGALARLDGVHTLFEPELEELTAAGTKFLGRFGLSWADIDLVVTGENGDIRFRPYYEAVSAMVPGSATRLAFKHICGEFDTAAGFALWQAAHILHRQQVPGVMVRHGGTAGPIRNILIYNNYYGRQHAFYLLGV